MISEKTIDETTAKYWCAFADKKFKSAIDQVLKTINNNSIQQQAENTITTQIKQSSHIISENFTDAFKSISRIPTVGGPGMTFQISNADPKTMEQQAKHALAATMTTGALAIPGVRNGVRKIIKTGSKIVTKNPIKSTALVGATASLIDSSGNNNDSWLIKLEKFVNKAWDIGKFMKDHGKALAVAGTVVYALFQTAEIWLPFVSIFIKNILRGNSLAILEFDSNGTYYKMAFDIKYNRWQLSYKGFSLSTPPPEETEQLMNTILFKRFFNQCKKYMEPIVNNTNRTAILNAISNLSDKKTKDILLKIFDENSITLKNMYELKYRY